MFELSIALKYLIPRWRQLSVSIISVISMLVIGMVVWLVLVFFSVTSGLEKLWIDKLIALTAPVRVTPTSDYYRSFYYLSDSISSDSDYTLKSIAEKRESAIPLSYNADIDEEIPMHWSSPDLDQNGAIKDLVKIAFAEIDGVPNVSAEDFEMTVGNLKLKQIGKSEQNSQISQASYLGSFDTHNSGLVNTIQPLSAEDLNHLYFTLAYAPENGLESNAHDLFFATPSAVQENLQRFFSNVTITSLKTPETGWVIPHHLFPKEGSLTAIALLEQHPKRLVIPQNNSQLEVLKEKYNNAPLGKLRFDTDNNMLVLPNDENILLGHDTVIATTGALTMTGAVQDDAITTSRHPSEVPFEVAFTLQNTPFSGVVSIRNLEIAKADVTTQFKDQPEKPPFWSYVQNNEYVLPKDPQLGDGILLPKTFREAHVKIGDQGTLSYYSPTTSSVQEMRLPIYVAGFYDPGIIPIGGKFVIANKKITSLFRLSHMQEDSLLSNGINVRFSALDKADQVKEALEKRFQEAGIAPYWKVETYKEYEFTRDLIQQLHSEKNLFTLISTVIIIVACSNIISMLIILVNDKKLEIGILRSMGASSPSVACIFGFCGIIMGFVGSLIGAIAAFLTLHNIQALVRLLSWIQGYDMFNPMFYGDTLPHDMSGEALIFVFFATIVISLIAGLVPAAKASMLRPSTILRSE